MRKRRDPFERFLEKVSAPVGLYACTEWTGLRNRAGYGVFSEGKTKILAHVWYYTHVNGPVPQGLQLDHLCVNPACVKLEHLEPVTGKENCKRAYARRREKGQVARKGVSPDKCPHGHEFTLVTTYYYKDGRRACKTCMNARSLARYYAVKTAKGTCKNGHPYPPGKTRCAVCVKAAGSAGCSSRWEKPNTHCGQGHEFTPENTFKARNGTRGCRTCRRAYFADRSRKQREANTLRSHCKNGHIFAEDNTYTDKRGRKMCMTCQRESGKLAKGWNAR